MKNLKIFNQASFVYLFFAAVIVVFVSVVAVTEGARTLLFGLYVTCSVLSALALFVLEGFYYPKLLLRKSINEGKEKGNSFVNKIDSASRFLTILLGFLFFGVLFFMAAVGWNILWLIASLVWLIITSYSFKMVRNNLKSMQEIEAQKTAASYLLELGINRQGVENCIWSISNKEQRVVRRRWNLVASFFPVSIIVIWVVIKALMLPVVDQLLVMEHDRAIVTRIIITLLVYIFAVIIGYVWHSSMGKRLQELWEIKRSFSNLLNVVKA